MYKVFTRSVLAPKEQVDGEQTVESDLRDHSLSCRPAMGQLMPIRKRSRDGHTLPGDPLVCRPSMCRKTRCALGPGVRRTDILGPSGS